MIKERCWFSQIDFFIEYVPHRVTVFVSFQPVLSRPHTQTRIVFFLGYRMSIRKLEVSPNRVLIELSRIAFPIIVLSEGDRTDFALEDVEEFFSAKVPRS